MEIPRPIPGWRPSTPPITSETALSQPPDDRPIAIHFWAPWDGYDPLMDKHLRQLAERFSSRVQFYSCNVDLEENRGLCEQCQILNVPALSIRVNGVWQQAIVGCRLDADELAEEIERRRSGKMPLQRAGKAWFWFTAIGRMIAGGLVFLSRAAFNDRP